jgi:hypothetical protein
MFDPRKSLVQLRNNHTRLVKSAGIPGAMEDAVGSLVKQRQLGKRTHPDLWRSEAAIADHLKGRQVARDIADVANPKRVISAKGTANTYRYHADNERALQAQELLPRNIADYTQMATTGRVPEGTSLGLPDRLDAFKTRKDFAKNRTSEYGMRGSLEERLNPNMYTPSRTPMQSQDELDSIMAHNRHARTEQAALEATTPVPTKQPRLLQRNDGGVDVEGAANDYRPLFAPFDGWRR